MSNVHPLIQEQINSLNESMGDDFQFHVWVRFGGGKAATIFNDRMRVTVLLEMVEDDTKVQATVSANVPGFFGCIQGSKMILPNKMLIKSIEQVETILHFLPEKGTANINDFYGHVAADYMLEKRKERRAKRLAAKD